MKPLMLKDYLNESDSNADYPMRVLIESELRSKSALTRTRSKSALSKLSSFISLDFLLLSCSPRKSSRTFSIKNQNQNPNPNPNGSFWKIKRAKNQDDKLNFRVKDIVRLNSFDFSPNLEIESSSSSSSRSWSQSDCTGSDFLCSSNGSSEFLPDVVESGCTGTGTGEEKRSPVRTESLRSGHGGRNEKENEEEKEQLSPLSVMDFPFEEEEIETEEQETSCSSESESSCFNTSLASIERAKEELLQKIRIFECLAELEPLNLNDQFSAVDDESTGQVSQDEESEQTSIHTQALHLLSLVKTNSSIHSDFSLESLLIDFFTEQLSNNTNNNNNHNNNSDNNNKSDYIVGLKSVEFVRKWMEGESDCWEERECRGEMEIGQMDVNGRWRCFDEQKADVAADLGFRVWESLLDEVVQDLVLC